MKHFCLLTLTLLFSFAVLKAQEPHATYYQNGQKKTQGNIDGKMKVGEWTYFHDNGKVMREGIYKEGHLYGNWNEYYKNGQLKSSGNYGIRGGEAVKHGEWTWYHKNGAKKMEGTYRLGTKTGVWEEFNTLGIVINKKTL